MQYYYFEKVEYMGYNRLNSRKRKVNTIRYFIMLLIFITITLTTILSLNKFAYANNNEHSMESKIYKSVTIFCGDTLETIAEEYSANGYSTKSSFVREICHINNITESTELIAGNYIIIPYYEEISN